MDYVWNFGELAQPKYITLLASGFATTLLISLLAVVVGTPFGLLLGTMASVGSFELYTTEKRPFIGRYSISAIRWAITLLIDAIRAIPLLLLILLFYYGLPVLAGELWGNASSISASTSGTLALALSLAAFYADLVRGSGASYPRTQILAARSLGMTKWMTWRRIVVPGVLRETFPGLVLLWITIWKMSTLCSAIAVYEVMHSADAIIQSTYRPLEVYVVLSLLFIMTITPLSMFARKLETSAKLRRRS